MLYNIYSKTITKPNSLINKLIRFGITRTTNLFVPLYYKITTRKDVPEAEIIVSLTTFPKRIDRIWIVIESILRQSIKPKKIVLTISKSQFSSKYILPKNLKKMIDCGNVEVIWTEDDLRSHKKYFYAMKKYPNDIIVTIDDDFIYEKRMLEFLYKFHIIHPKCVITNLAVEKKGDNYNDWKNLFFAKKPPSYSIMQLGGSGVLYPPHSLHKDAFNVDLIMKNCPLADDIWLNAMAILNSTSIVKTDYPIYLMPLLFKKNVTLYEHNVQKNGNNEQIKNINSMYNKPL